MRGTEPMEVQTSDFETVNLHQKEDTGKNSELNSTYCIVFTDPEASEEHFLNGVRTCLFGLALAFQQRVAHSLPTQQNFM